MIGQFLQVSLQTGGVAIVLPLYRKDMTTTLNGNICPRRKGWTVAAQAQQFQLLFHDRLFQCLSNLHFRQICTVDFFVAALACASHCLTVIFARK